MMRSRLASWWLSLRRPYFVVDKYEDSLRGVVLTVAVPLTMTVVHLCVFLRLILHGGGFLVWSLAVSSALFIGWWCHHFWRACSGRVTYLVKTLRALVSSIEGFARSPALAGDADAQAVLRSARSAELLMIRALRAASFRSFLRGRDKWTAWPVADRELLLSVQRSVDVLKVAARELESLHSERSKLVSASLRVRGPAARAEVLVGEVDGLMVSLRQQRDAAVRAREELEGLAANF